MLSSTRNILMPLTSRLVGFGPSVLDTLASGVGRNETRKRVWLDRDESRDLRMNADNGSYEKVIIEAGVLLITLLFLIEQVGGCNPSAVRYQSDIWSAAWILITSVLIALFLMALGPLDTTIWWQAFVEILGTFIETAFFAGALLTIGIMFWEGSNIQPYRPVTPGFVAMMIVIAVVALLTSLWRFRKRLGVRWITSS